jgi:multicomponent Na+:H+ antiporter subunit F
MTDSFLHTAAIVSFGVLAVSLVLTFARLVRGPTLPDRVVALDLMAFVIISMAGVYSIATDHAEFLSVALALGVFIFVGTVAYARYIERIATTGQEDEG